ncbi:class I SAM-dependent methyltransferase [Halalkalibaculum sp. DA3122]|uniref:class I SAM-dependent methyltransferase n=1 Tax=Halalkalibaculum sp. DA3122 TaxID=3373607 RepID=UPI003754B38E
MKSTITYLKSFIKDKDVASVTPSSKLLIRRVCGPIDFEKDNVILEYGTGTGVFADYLLKHLTTDSRLILFETNEAFYEKLQEISDPRVEVFNESVEHVKSLLGSRYLNAVDYVISGIPFSFLEPETKSSILLQTKEMLKQGGKFLAYQTSGHLKDPLREVFGSGNVSTEMEFLNVPPMVVYEATKR